MSRLVIPSPASETWRGKEVLPFDAGADEFYTGLTMVRGEEPLSDLLDERLLSVFG